MAASGLSIVSAALAVLAVPFLVSSTPSSAARGAPGFSAISPARLGGRCGTSASFWACSGSAPFSQVLIAARSIGTALRRRPGAAAAPRRRPGAATASRRRPGAPAASLRRPRAAAAKRRRPRTAVAWLRRSGATAASHRPGTALATRRRWGAMELRALRASTPTPSKILLLIPPSAFPAGKEEGRGKKDEGRSSNWGYLLEPQVLLSATWPGPEYPLERRSPSC